MTGNLNLKALKVIPSPISKGAPTHCGFNVCGKMGRGRYVERYERNPLPHTDLVDKKKPWK